MENYMSDEKRNTNEAVPNPTASELSDESLKNVVGGEAVALSFTKIAVTYSQQQSEDSTKEK